MLVGRLVMPPLVFFLGFSISLGQDFRVGESVIVATDDADVKTKQRTLGSVPRGTEFEIRQVNKSWLLGEFRIGDQRVLGWVQAAAVRQAAPSFDVTKTHEFSWENLFIALVKLDEDFAFDAYVDDYLKTFRLAVWEKYRDDEFQLARKRTEALRLFRDRVDAFDLNQHFLVRANLTMQKYNFERSAFPIEEATSDHFWNEHRYTDSEFPHDIRVFFVNPSLISYVPMPPDAAERYLSVQEQPWGD